MSQQLIQELIDNIPDPKMRAHYGQIVNSRIVAKVNCLSNECKGRCVGYLKSDGFVVEEITVDKKTGARIAGIETSRDRFDGQKGFKCTCGNSSIVALSEQGIITAAQPNTADLEQIAQNLKKLPINYTEINGVKEVDGFAIERYEV